MNEAEIWQTANDMIRQYGAEAQARAKARAQTLLDYEILEGAEEWRRVADAIAELERKKPDAGEPVN